MGYDIIYLSSYERCYTMRRTSILRVGLLLTLLLGLCFAIGVAHASSADAVWPESSGESF